MVQNLGVRTAKARSGAIAQRFETTGTVGYNERAVFVVQARAAGYIERLHLLVPLDPVARGAALAEMLFPEWTTAQEEYLILHRSEDGGAAPPRARRAPAPAAARHDRRADHRARAQRTRRATRFTLTAPISGVIAELRVREGANVVAGQTLFRIVDLSSVWVNAEVPETQASWVTSGARVEARVPAYPGTVFLGRVGVLLPEVNPATRTVRARIELDNRGGQLLPGMFARIVFQRAAARKHVMVPSEAVIRTGVRSVVILALGEGRFRSAEVEVGFESGGQSEIRKGLKAGDEVVLSGQFLIDSEGSLLAAVVAARRKPGQGAPEIHKGRGKVSEVDAGARARRARPRADSVAALAGDAHGIRGRAQARARAAQEGDAVRFELRGQPNKDGEHIIRNIAPERKK